MSVFESSTSVLAVMTMLGCVLLIGTGMLAYRLHRINQLAREDINRLTARLDVFAQTSIEVARTVERLTVAPTTSPNLASSNLLSSNLVSSRRWLLDEAQQRLQDGDELGQIGRRLGLNHDEISLLHRVCLQRQVTTA